MCIVDTNVFFHMLSIVKIYSLATFKYTSTVLVIRITMLDMMPLEIFYPTIGSLHFWTVNFWCWEQCWVVE